MTSFVLTCQSADWAASALRSIQQFSPTGEFDVTRLDGETLVLNGAISDGRISLILGNNLVKLEKNVRFRNPIPSRISGASIEPPSDNWAWDFLPFEYFEKRGFTGNGVKVAVLDTGIDPTHPTFSGLRIRDFRRFSLGDGSVISSKPDDDHFHGTHVTSIIGGKDKHRRGVAHNADYYIGAVLDSNNDGSAASVQGGLCWLLNDVKPNVVNLSVQYPGSHEIWRATLDKLAAEGCIVVSASGNTFRYSNTAQRVCTPGWYSDWTLGPNKSYGALISVGAHDSNGDVIGTSSGGTIGGLMSPMVVAPGKNINGATLGGQYGNYTGTSQAAPQICGLIAALLSVPGIDNSKCMDILRKSTVDVLPLGPDIRSGFGRIDGAKLVSLVEKVISKTGTI